MSEFNGRKFYGFSLYNDPSLTTTTRNFEFQYARRENLDRVIEQVQQSNENPLTKQRKSSMLTKYCGIKKPAKPAKQNKDISAPFQTKDVDVETRLSSQESSNKVRGRLSSQDSSKMRDLTENEITNLINKTKKRSDKSPHVRHQHIVRVPSDLKNDSPIDATAQPTKPMSDCDPLEYSIIDELRVEQPKWVEIVEKSSSMPILYDDVVQPMLPSPPLLQQNAVMKAMPDAMQNEVNLAYDTTPYDPSMMHYQCNMYSYQSYYDIVDSDLEDEMKNRNEYTKYISDRPEGSKLISLSEENNGCGQFIEMEGPTTESGVSFLKSTIPMRYTDLTDELPENDGSQEIVPTMQVIIKNVNADDEQGDTQSKKSDTELSVKVAETPKKKKSKLVRKRKSSAQQNKESVETKESKTAKEKMSLAPSSARILTPTKPKQGQLDVEKKKVTNKTSTYSYSSAASSRRSTPRAKARGIPTKSLAELKSEKVHIYGNMACSQERIIATLDKLQYSLLEIHIPENSFDTSKRQKNAFEFSVRFSRNYLFPLKSMIEDLKSLTVAQVNSALTNEACARVASIYALILTSLHTYQKQLRYFVLDQVPQKLTTLIELMQMTTNVCLEKSIFDPNDPLIESLRDRCSKFVGFLEDMHEQRFLTAQTNYKQLNYEKIQPPKYDLKMFMNNLHMYEPKLVPKKNTRRSHAKSSKNHTDFDVDESDIPYSKRTMVEENISTHVQNTKLPESSGLLADWQTIVSKSTNAFLASSKTSDQLMNSGLNKAIVDALQTVTKEQVRQVMQPIIQSLGNALEMKKNSEMNEAILNAFNSKLICTVQDDNKNQNDIDNAKSNKVVEVKDNDVYSHQHIKSTVVEQQPHQTNNASKSLKATKQTKQLPQQRASRKAGKTTITTTTTSTAAADVVAATAAQSALLSTPPQPQPAARRRRRDIEVETRHHNRHRHADDYDQHNNDDVDVMSNNCGQVDAGDGDDDDVNGNGNVNGRVNADANRATVNVDDVNIKSGVNIIDNNNSNNYDGDDDEGNDIRDGVGAKGVKRLTGGGVVANRGLAAGHNARYQQICAAYRNRYKAVNDDSDIRHDLLTLRPSDRKAASNACTDIPINRQLDAFNSYMHDANNLVAAYDDGTASSSDDVNGDLYASNFRVSIVNVKQKSQQQEQQQQQQSRIDSKQQRYNKRMRGEPKVVSSRTPQATNGKNTRALQTPAVAGVPAAATNANATPSRRTTALTTATNIKRTLYKKKRAERMLQPPPPAPAGTPSTSARSFRRQSASELQNVGKHSGSANQHNQKLQQQQQDKQKSAAGRRYKRRPTAANEPNQQEAEISGTMSARTLRSNKNVAINIPFTYNFNSCTETTQQMLHNLRERSYRTLEHSSSPRYKSKRESSLYMPPLTAVQLLQDATTTDASLTPGTNRSGSSQSTGAASAAATAANADSSRMAEDNVTEGNILEKVSQTQLKKIKVLQHKMKHQERKQKKQMRTLDKLNNSATQLYAAASGTALPPTTGADSNAETTKNVHGGEGAGGKLDAIIVDNMMRERNKFVESCRHNRFYANPNYDEPWRIFSKLSEKLANEIVCTMEQDFSNGVSKFVEDFLEMETKT